MLRKTLLSLLLSLLVLAACQSEPPQENTVPEQVFTTHETATYKINLTENYMGADPKTPTLNVVMAWMTTNGFDAQGFSKFIQANATEIAYVGINTVLTPTNLLSYFTLTGGEKPADFSVDTFEKNYNETVGIENFLSQEQKELGEHTVEVLHYTFSQGDTQYVTSFYFLENETQSWKFEFVAPEPDYTEKVTEFEQIVAKFEPRPGP